MKPSDNQSTFFGTHLMGIDQTHIVNVLQVIFCCQCTTGMPKVVLMSELSCSHSIAMLAQTLHNVL